MFIYFSFCTLNYKFCWFSSHGSLSVSVCFLLFVSFHFAVTICLVPEKIDWIWENNTKFWLFVCFVGFQILKIWWDFVVFSIWVPLLNKEIFMILKLCNFDVSFSYDSYFSVTQYEVSLWQELVLICFISSTFKKWM